MTDITLENPEEQVHWLLTRRVAGAEFLRCCGFELLDALAATPRRVNVPVIKSRGAEHRSLRHHPSVDRSQP